MKKLLFAMSALAAISLLAPSAGFAQFQNRVGIYADEIASAAHANPATNVPTNVYMLLFNPVGNSGPVTSIEAFECIVSVTPTTGIFKLSETVMPGVQVINLGDTSSLANMEYIVGSATPKAVVNNVCVLVQFQMLITVSPPPTFRFFVKPTSVPSIPGQMAWQAGGGPPLYVMTPSNTAESFDEAVFGFHLPPGEPVATEDSNWGNVKALFR